MSRNEILALIFLISFVVATDLWASAAAEGEKGKPEAEKVSPPPIPPPPVKTDNSKDKTSEPDRNPSKSGPKNVNAPTPQVPPLPTSSNTSNPTKEGSGVKDDTRKKGGKPPVISASPPPDKSQEDGVCHETESSITRRCSKVNLIACLQDPATGSQELFLLVKNRGVDTLTVNIKAPASKINTKVLNLTKQQHEKINISVNPGESLKIVLKAGNEVCVLQYEVPASPVNFFRQLPSYATRMTPIYGAYFFFLTMLIVGGTWACCKFGKKGRQGDGGVPYQELEMGLPQSSSPTVADTADGWDEGWDDDWEEKTTARTPEIRPVGNVSANGLTSRASNREGWDDDWDD